MADVIKAVMVGDGGVGKSCLVIQFTQMPSSSSGLGHERTGDKISPQGIFLSEYDPTIENSYRKQLIVDDHTAVIDILDTAGREEYSAMRDQYMRAGEAFFLVFSLTNRRSFEEISQFRDALQRVKDTSDIPLVIIGNKVDLEHQREVSQQDVADLVHTWGGVPYFETSAKTRQNVDEAFEAGVREARRFLEASAPVPVVAKKSKPGRCEVM